MYKLRTLGAALALTLTASGVAVTGFSDLASAHHPLVTATTGGCLAADATTWPVTLVITSDDPARGKEYHVDSSVGVYAPTGWVGEATPFTATVNVPVTQASFTETVSVSWRMLVVHQGDDEGQNEGDDDSADTSKTHQGDATSDDGDDEAHDEGDDNSGPTYVYGPTGVAGTATAYRPAQCPVPTDGITEACANGVLTLTNTSGNDGFLTNQGGDVFVAAGATVPFPGTSSFPVYAEEGFVIGIADYKPGCPQPPTEIAIPATPSVSDPCGVNNATWATPADTDQLDWTLGVDGHLTVTVKGNLVFTDGTTSHDYGAATDSGTVCPVTPTPTHEDPIPVTV